MSKSRPAAVIVLAAGEGTRMKSATPKVLHPILGRSMLAHVLTAAAGLAAEQTMVVVGHGRDAVTEHLKTLAPKALPVVQAEQRGTGHAVRLAVDSASDLTGTVVVVCGDTPLLTTQTLVGLYSQHQRAGCAATVLSALAPDPAGYGRILRDSQGRMTSIVEDRDATPDQRGVSEINAGIYAFEVSQLTRMLAQLTGDNSQGEQYLTDVLGSLRSAGETVEAVVAPDHVEVIGVNDRVQLAEAARLMRERVNHRWMREGVTIVDPFTTWIDVDVMLAPDTTLRPNTILSGATTLARGAEVGPGCALHDTVVDEHAIVRETTSHGAHIGAHAVVGPYTFLRPGTNLGPNTKAGAFVETKNARLGTGSKVPHLSYVGDADIGEGSNIGAATIFVNYDGVAKHRTTIGNHARIGSDTMLVAPLTIGDGAYTAAGSVITEDVPAGAMAVGRSRQRTIRGWVARRRAGSAAAAAGAAAERSQGTHDLDHPADPSWENGVPTNPEAAAAGEPDREGHVE